MSSRSDNLVAVRPALSLPASVDAMTTCESTKELSDHDWVAAKYANLRQHVRGLVPQEPKLLEWSLWLDRLPMAVFLAGGDGELKGVRGASTDDKRAEEAGLVLQRWALQYDFDIERIFETDRNVLRRYISLFSIA